MAIPMKRFSALILTIALASLLAGCGKSNTVSRSDRNHLARACTQSGGADEETCNCFADLAREQLSPRSFAFVLANMEGDTERARDLQGDLTMDEASEAGSFIFNAFGTCAIPGARLSRK